MNFDKKLLLIFVLFNNSPMLPMNYSSWLSPSRLTNWMSQKYNEAMNNVKNMWAVKQIKAIKAKKTTAQDIENEWADRYFQKETFSKKPITQAEISAIKFKTVLEKSALDSSTENPPGIMARFLFHPEKFLFGASSSSYQYEGGLDVTDNNGMYRNANAQFYYTRKEPLPLAEDAIDFWNRYKEDIKQMKEELGINSFRLSIAWDRVEPQQGKYDRSAILHYMAIIRTLKENNIEPIVVLHHYTIPTWFENSGGFEKEENIDYFVKFAEKMYDALYEYVTYWSTFNAIEGYAFKGYKTLDGPPGKTASLALTQQVMANMLESHVRIYQTIKNPESGLYAEKLKKNNNIPNPQIGIQKNIVILDPSPNSNALTYTASSAISVIGEGAQNKGFFDFFTTGTFNIILGLQYIYHRNEKAPQSLDWIGLNIYSNMRMYLLSPQEETDEDKTTANKTYRDYPEGIYRATQEINKRIAQPLNIPIIITENGIATDDNQKRTRFFSRALFTIRMLIKEGFPIIGYTPWASHDNYEWPTEKQRDAFTSRRYGFFEVNFNKNSPTYLERALKPGAYYYRDFIKTYFDQPKLPLPKILPIKSQKRIKISYYISTLD